VGTQKEGKKKGELELELMQNPYDTKAIAAGRSGQKFLCACGDSRIAPLPACSI
jgi:hypothetical protein